MNFFKTKIVTTFALTTFAISPALSQLLYKENPKMLEEKIEQVIAQMTLEEKVAMCHGTPFMAFKGVDRLEVPNVYCTDGPRGPNATGGLVSTAFPTGVLFGATWNPEIVYQAGKVQGEETRACGRGVLLGPSSNILRDPLGGRFFEYYTEDPMLNSAITVAHVKGIQSEGVAASIKHYACNNREFNRNEYMSMVDDRTMHEIYLPAFKAAVEQANVWTVMTSANGMNGDFVSDSRKMLTDILKEEWGFDGFVLTDWLQTRSTEKAALAGLDVSMPGGDNCGFGTPLLNAVKEGRIDVSVVDDKVRRVLRIFGRIGVLDKVDLKKGAEANTVEHQKVVRKIAEEGIVLLKNENGFLPLDKNTPGKILVTGHNANKPFCVFGMGGSSHVTPPYEITPLEGIKNLYGADNVEYFDTESLGGYTPIIVRSSAEADSPAGWKATYRTEGESDVVERLDPEIDFMWEMKSPAKGIAFDDFHATYQGWVIPPVDGIYTLKLTVGGWCAIFPESCAGGAPTIFTDDSKPENGTVTASLQLQKDVPYFLCVHYRKRKDNDAALRLEWKLPESSLKEQELAQLYAKASGAKAVIFVGGLDMNLDTEGRDRSTMEFPQDQEVLINNLAAKNKNIAVVLVNGSPMEIGGWLPNVPAVVEAWYSGMEGGNALADILFGNVNPSGRLPFSWPKKLSDAPYKALATEDVNFVNYDEKLMVGYRYYDTHNVEPEFAFGHGLTYSTFKYKKPKVSKSGVNSVKASIEITNSSKRDGAEVVQLYVNPINPSVDRPVHELKAFRKVYIKSGETQVVEFELAEDAFSYYDDVKGKWAFDPCQYNIEFGAASDDIRTKTKIIF